MSIAKLKISTFFVKGIELFFKVCIIGSEVIEVSITSDRIKQAMDLRGYRQVDVVNLAKPICDAVGEKLDKSAFSQYMSGRVTPGSAKLAILGEVLGVNSLWLKGVSDDMRVPRESPRLSGYQEAEFMKAGLSITPLFDTETDDFWDLTDNGVPPELKFKIVDIGTGESVTCQKEQIDAAFEAGVKPLDLFNRILRAKNKESDELTEYLEMLRTRPECRMLFSLTKDATKEDVEKAVAIITALRSTEGK